MYYVYRIKIGGKIRYVGMTQDIEIREKQHNYLCFKKGKKKELYNKIRNLNPNIRQIKLEWIGSFKLKAEARKYECLLILLDHFKGKNLWQRVPRISDV